MTASPGPTGSNSAKSSWAFVAVLTLAVIVCYANSLAGQFVLDDLPAIQSNNGLRSLTNLARFRSPRGLVDLSFALNLAFGGLNPVGYHVVNVAIHLASGLALFGLARRTLLGSKILKSFADNADVLALTIALLWLVHPLTTQAVTYVVQRYESAAAMFYLLALYAFARGARSTATRGWFFLVVLCFALGLRSKETVLTLPVALAWYDRAFIANSWRDLLSRKYLYLSLALMSALLVGSNLWHVAEGLSDQIIGGQQVADVATEAVHGSTLFVEGLTPWTYLLSQPAALLRYLQLSVWPVGLCLDYGWTAAKNPIAVLPALIVVLVLLAATGWAVFRRSGIGFLAGSFFLFLVPSSSIIPIRDVVVEHRVYLPLAAVIALLVLAAFALAQRFAAQPVSRRSILTTTTLVALVLGSLTITRNACYCSEIAIWEDTLLTAPENPRAHSSLGTAYMLAGRETEALAQLETAVQLDPKMQCYNLAVLLDQLGRLDEASSAYRRAISLHPESASAYNNLATLTERSGDRDEALRLYHKAIELDPNYALPHNNLASSLQRAGSLPEAEAEFQRSLAIDPNDPLIHYQLANVLAEVGRAAEAEKHFRTATSLDPTYAKAYFKLGLLLLMRGQERDAIEPLQIATNLEPDNAPTKALLQQVRVRLEAHR